MYTIYLGASRLGTRLGSLFAQNVKREELLKKLQPVLERYKHTRQSGESFGDFCHRLGMEELRETVVCAAA
jgi:sulfite reductase (ferredoxin)